MHTDHWLVIFSRKRRILLARPNVCHWPRPHLTLTPSSPAKWGQASPTIYQECPVTSDWGVLPAWNQEILLIWDHTSAWLRRQPATQNYEGRKKDEEEKAPSLFLFFILDASTGNPTRLRNKPDADFHKNFKSRIPWNWKTQFVRFFRQISKGSSCGKLFLGNIWDGFNLCRLIRFWNKPH